MMDEIRAAKSVERGTSFGQMLTVQRHGHTVELLRFDREGKDHTHENWENAVCLSGPCALIYNDGTPHDVEIGRTYTVPPGVPHRMLPLTPEPSVWLIWYSDEVGEPVDRSQDG